MKVYQLKGCARTTRKAGIDDASLSDAVQRAQRGKVDADLGGCLIKQRIAREGKGKSGGHRYLIAFRADHRAVFLFGFAKNAKDNIVADELEMTKKVGAVWLGLSKEKIDEAIRDKQLIEVAHDNKHQNEDAAPKPTSARNEGKR